MYRVALKDISLYIVAVLLLVSISAPFTAYGQDSNYSLSVTPPFFQMTITPGEEWSSFIKIVNVNDFPITLYASVVNFEANQNEDGKGKFSPLLSEEPEYRAISLAGWIDVTSEPLTIEAGKTAQLPFSIRPPLNASPGGHYAAILVGNQPILDPSLGSGIAVSSLISSLIFARVQGDVVESGGIREFSSDKTFYQTPEVEFALRFENTGNVHLLPQGDITIYNMWGKERGTIPVNQKTTFGNVLPETTRKFNFVWSGEPSPLEIGRYKAIATLAFGNDERKNISSITTFWVVPVVPVLSILGTITLLILVVTWFIRGYIRRALSLERARLGVATTKPKAKTLAQPLVDGVMDLRNVTFEEKESTQKLSLTRYLLKYKNFFAFLLILIIAIVLARLFFSEVLVSDRSYEIQVDSEISVPFSTE